MVQLIDITDFTGKADLAANTLSEKVTSFIAITQDTFLPAFICNELYEQIQQEYSTPAYMSPENLALLPYIKNYLVYKTYARYLVSSNAISTAAGIRVTKDSISDPASDQMMSRLIKQAEKDANFYQDKLIAFLERNQNDYPLWKDSLCGCSDRYVNNLNTFSGIGGKYKPKQIRFT
jgi:hypothetical protein